MKFMRFKTEKEIEAIVEAFENGAISRDDWRHAEHLAVALYYLSAYDYETALIKMRDGIFNLLRSFGVDLTQEMPYHETMTVFWLRAVNDFRDKNYGCSTVEICNELIEKLGKDYPLKFYSREVLFSDKARAVMVEPDLREIVY